MRILLTLLLSSLPLTAQQAKPIFDGKTLKGWNVHKGDEKFWTVKDGMIVGGSLTEKVTHNTFLSSQKSYQNYELTFKVRMVNGSGFVNSGMQVRSQRKGASMIGYQVDIGKGYWGMMYDEHRRNKMIGLPVDKAATAKTAHDWKWNDYKIICNGPRIQSWINGVAALDYTEKDKNIPLDGVLGLQAHGGGKFLVQMKDVIIKELPSTPGAPTWAKDKAAKQTSKQEQKRREKAARMKVKKTASTPAEELAGFTLPEGFTAELVSSEQQGVGKPITVTWDSAGRMWTMTAFEYPIDANENAASAEQIYARGGKDKVLVFDNPYGKGPHTPREFAKGLVIPLGLAPYKGGAFVQYGHDVRYYYDKNKDGKADGYDVVLTGFGIQDSHLFPHQFERTPGGWFYLAQGLFNSSKVTRPGGKPFANGKKEIPFIQTKLARFRPDGSEFEPLTAGPNNIWGLSQTRDGRVFIQEANDWGIPVAEYEPGTHYASGRNDKLQSYAPQIPPSFKGLQMGGTGLSGLALVEDKNSPFRLGHSGDVFVLVNPITSRLQIVNVNTNDKDQYQYKKQDDFMLSQDKWFRPIAAHFGPDGCLYVVDWYNKIISHNEVPRAHPDRDKTRGRIWRIRHVSQKIVTPPNLTKLPSAKVANYLGGDNALLSRLAWHELADRNDASAATSLEQIILDSGASVSRRCAALWALEGMKKLNASTLTNLAKSKDVSLRYQALRAASELSIEERAFLLIAKNSDFKSHRRTRAALANAVRHHKHPTPAIIALAASLGDPPVATGVWDKYDRDFQRYLARWAMEKHRPVTVKMLESSHASDLTSEQFLLAIQSLAPDEASAQLISIIPRLKRPLSKAEMTLLGSQIKNPKVKEGLRKLLADPTRQLSLLKTIEQMDAKLAADQELATMVGNACLAVLKNQPSKENQLLVLRLAAKFRIKSLEVPVKKWLLTENRTVAEIQLGLHALSEMRSQSRDLFEKLYQHSDPQIKRLAIIALASLDDVSIVNYFASAWDQLPGDHRQLVIAGLTSNRAKAEALAKASTVGQFKGLTSDSLGNIIAALGANHPSVKSILKNTPGLLQPVIRLTGNPADKVDHKINLKGAFTVEAWVRLDPGIGPDDSILSHGKGGADLNFAGGKFRFYAGAQHGDRVIAKRAMQPNLWMHCAVTRNAKGQFKIYLDGELDTAQSKAITEDFTDLSIGNSTAAGGSGFAMREFRVWSYERSAVQIQTDHLTDYSKTKLKGLSHRISGGTAGLKFAGKGHIALVGGSPKLITPAAAKSAQEKFQKYLTMANARGDAAKGKTHFATCMACHKVGDAGGVIGPDLSGAGAMSTEALLHNILTPNAKMESGYYRHDLILKNGSKVSGSMVEENKTTISIQPVGGSVQVVSKKNITKHNIAKSSLMPEGLIDHLTPAQVADLFTYLRTLK